jgi:hypothetical protein
VKDQAGMETPSASKVEKVTTPTMPSSHVQNRLVSCESLTVHG